MTIGNLANVLLDAVNASHSGVKAGQPEKEDNAFSNSPGALEQRRFLDVR
jgi:hypothetical protein